MVEMTTNYGWNDGEPVRTPINIPCDNVLARIEAPEPWEEQLPSPEDMVPCVPLDSVPWRTDTDDPWQDPSARGR